MVWRRVAVVLKFDIVKLAQLEQLLKVEEELIKMGVVFDTGYDLIDKQRLWQLDTSLEGAEVFINDPDKSK